MNLAPVSKLLTEGATIFYSDYGKKAVDESWTKRLSKIIKKAEDVKPYTNLHIATGRDSLFVDNDIDCPEGNLLADYFLPHTGMTFGRESTPRAHRLYKVIDLKKEHTRKYWSFKDKSKSMLVELRANKHYTMCDGQYDNGEKVTWTLTDEPAEVTWETLHKSNSLLAVACVVLRRYPNEGLRNEYIKKMIGALWQHKVEEDDCRKIIEAVTITAQDNDKSRIARITDIYKRERTEHIEGLPKLAEEFNWTDIEVKEFKKLLLRVTGRDLLPEFTNDFVNRVVYIMKEGLYYDLEDKEMYKGEAIDVKYAKYFPNYTPLKWWKMHKDNKICVGFTYKPDNPNRFVTINKKQMINTYEKNDIEPDDKADTDIFYDLLEHVIPHDEHREHFLDWFAFNIQFPGVKIRYALLLQSSEFQIGKGSLFDILRDILGHHNTRKIDLKEALDKGKKFLIDRQCVLIDEAKASGTWGEKTMFVNTLKTLITEGTAGTRQLYKDYEESDTCTNYWINTNFKDAFPLPLNEVRYWVYFSPAKPNETLLDEFHNQRLNGNLVQGVYADMLKRDLSNFKNTSVAPRTPYLNEMSELADKPVNDWVKEHFEQGVYPLETDLITATELFDFIKRESKVKITRERDVAEALKLIGGVRKRGCPVKQVGKDVNIWILRNHDQYTNLTAKELGAKYTPFFDDKRTRD
tara:strand:+ start:1074 stop:3143 length:2070 start_codon:yes stop_codon:yes gene_type:complete